MSILLGIKTMIMRRQRNEGHTRDKVPLCQGIEREKPTFTVLLLRAGRGGGHTGQGGQSVTAWGLGGATAQGQRDTQTQ